MINNMINEFASKNTNLYHFSFIRLCRLKLEEQLKRELTANEMKLIYTAAEESNSEVVAPAKI